MKLRNKKTGEVFNFSIKAETDNTASYFKLRTGSGGWEDGLLYGTLAELNEEWEDYTPKEPLIKDEKIRKAVRLCADIWGADRILVIKSGSRVEFSDGSPNMKYVSFMYAGWQDEIEDRTYYTIDELCGEEEE